MGYKTELNYILKCSNASDGQKLQNLKVGEFITITKSGLRTFILNAPIMISDHDWNILGMCIITQTITNQTKTELTAKLLTLFTKEESRIVTQIIQAAEKAKEL